MHDFKNDNLNAFIEKGVRMNAIMEQLENVKKTSTNDEVRAIAAAMLALITEVRSVVLFKP